MKKCPWCGKSPDWTRAFRVGQRVKLTDAARRRFGVGYTPTGTVTAESTKYVFVHRDGTREKRSSYAKEFWEAAS